MVRTSRQRVQCLPGSQPSEFRSMSFRNAAPSSMPVESCFHHARIPTYHRGSTRSQSAYSPNDQRSRLARWVGSRRRYTSRRLIKPRVRSLAERMPAPTEATHGKPVRGSHPQSAAPNSRIGTNDPDTTLTVRRRNVIGDSRSANPHVGHNS